jgi:uncharacterized membrane protein YjfL (UPF0719 family)
MRIDLLVGLMVEALAIVIVAKLARDTVFRLQGHAINELVVHKRSVGAAISQAGSAADVNVALAVGKAAISIATGLVLRGSMTDPTAGVLACAGWFVVGQMLMVAAGLVYCRLTPYDDLAEIRSNNLAAGFPIAGILLALGLVVEAAIATRVAASDGSLVPSALHVAKFLGTSLVLVYVFRFITALVLLPRVKLTKAIVEQRSVGAGLQEGVSFLLVSLIVTFFLT